MSNLIEINKDLAAMLVKEQFPQWQGLTITPVANSGWDNRTFHLGDAMSIRIPSNKEYAPQIIKEYDYLPQLVKAISICKITTPLALGQPSVHYPWHWSVNSWINGNTASKNNITCMGAWRYCCWKYFSRPRETMRHHRFWSTSHWRPSL